MRAKLGRPSPATATALLALFLALGGTTWAAVSEKVIPSRNSVGPRQLRHNAVVTGKIKNNSVTGAKVRDRSLTGSDINVAQLGTVPSAEHANGADRAESLGGHAAGCPAGTALLRGVCFDSSPNPLIGSLQAAADACASRGGFLPTPLQLYSVRGVINLGTGVGSDWQYTDSYYGNTTGGSYRTIVVNGTGALQEQDPGSPAHYVCAYPLVR